MAHGGYSNRRPTARKPANNRRIKGPKTGGVDKKKSKPKSVSLKNQIRSTQRILAKDLPFEVKEAQQKKLGELKKQQDMHTRLTGERKTFLLDRKKKFFERRKIERRIRRLEKQHRVSGGPTQEIDIAEQLSKLKEDLEYVRFFPKNEKYVALFMGGDDKYTVDRRDELRKQIKANIIAAAASGKDLEETGSEDDGLLEPSEDDFFLTGSSSDEADADDELTDKSTREQTSSTSGKAASGMSSDEKNQRQISARAFMLPPRPSKKSSSANVKSRFFEGSSSKKSFSHRPEASRSGNTSNSMSGSSFRNRGYSSSLSGNRNNLGSNSSYPGNINSCDSNSRNRGHSNSYTSNSSNLSSNTEPQKPRRKRRPKKKKEQA